MTPPENRIRVLHGDSREVLRQFPENHFDSVCTDPPYALVSITKRFGKAGAAPAKGSDAFMRASAGFMGQQWDNGSTAFDPDFWREVYRVLKPGAHLAAFSGTRTYHRMVVAIEDAGFEIRDQLAWAYGSGFPKSHDVSKGIDRSRAGLAFHEIRDYLRQRIKDAGLTQAKIKTELGYALDSGIVSHWVANSQPMVPGWKDWQKMKGLLRLDDRFDDLIRSEDRKRVGEKSSGIGTAFGDGEWQSGKSIAVAITAAESDQARQWEGWGTALKPAWEPICLARKPLGESTVAANVLRWGTGAINVDGCRIHADDAQGGEYTVTRLKPGATLDKTGGNWRPEEGGARYHGEMKPGRWPANILHDGSDEVVAAFPQSDGQQGDVSGAEPPRENAIYGADLAARKPAGKRGDSGSAARFFYTAKADADDRIGSKHPTVKPVDLIQWLVRLITPPGGLVLDCFAGSGTAGEAAFREGMRCVMIEREANFVADIERRIGLLLAGPEERAHATIKAKIADGRIVDDAGPLFGGQTEAHKPAQPSFVDEAAE